MEKIKSIWEKHKKKILIGTVLGGTLIIIFKRRSIRKADLVVTSTEELKWVFDNLEDALVKFKGLETANVALEMGKDVNMTTAVGEYTVIFS